MSDFTQNLKENSRPLFWLLPSLLVHGVIFGWMIFVIKPHMIGVDAVGEVAQQPAVSASAARVMEVAAQIELTQADEVRAKVEELLATEKMLADLEKQKEAEFALLAEELAAKAPELANEALSPVEAAQAQAVAAQAEALTATKAMDEARAKLDEMLKTDPDVPGDNKVSTPEKQQAINELVEATNKAAEAQSRAKDAQTQVTVAQTAATQQLAFREEKEFTDARRAQNEAAAAQVEANNRQDEAAAYTNTVTELKQSLVWINNHVKGAADGVRWRTERVENLTKSEPRLEENIAKAKDNLAKAEQFLAESQQKAQDAQDERSKNAAVKSVETAQKRIESAKAEIARQTKAVEKNKADRVKLEGEIKKVEEDLAKHSKSLEETTKRYQAAPAKAREMQEAALALQKKAQDAQGKATAAVAQATATAGAPQIAAANGGETSTPQIELNGKSFSELYQTAVEAESRIAGKFQTVRAAEVAVQRQIPIAEAQKYVEVAKPVRPEYKPPAKNLKDAKMLEEQNAQMEKALQEMDSMVALARSMAYQASNASVANKGVTVSVESIKMQAAQSAELAELAAEKDDQQAVDLAEMMKQIEGNDEGDGDGKGAEMQGAHDGAEGEHGGGQGPGGGNGEGKGQLAQTAGLPGQAGAGAPGAAGPKPSGKLYGGAGSGAPSLNSVAGAVPGRKIFRGGTSEKVEGSQWMFVDSWYVIGPFPNPQRRNIDTKFPPESVVDLDAHYQLENGDNLRWRYVRNTSPGISPPDERSFAIYYAYTTLWMDEARDMWIAVGSDDYSKIWINNMLVWASGMKHKNWRPNEGYRKVHLKKGLNHVLYRIENGQYGCMWSLMLNMQSEM